MITLTTPYNPGSLDDGKNYTHARVSRAILHESQSMVELHVRRGYVDNGWQDGKTKNEGHLIANNEKTPTGWDDFAALLTNDGEAGKDGFLRCCEQWLIDNGLYDGTV